MSEGVIKWFNQSRGFGLIAPLDGSEDVLLKDTIVDESQAEQVISGQRVLFELLENPNIPEARQISFIQT